MRLVDASPALFMIVASLATIIGTAGLAVWDGFTPGARFFPLIVGGIGLVLAGLLLWQQWRGTDAERAELLDRSAATRVGLTVAALVGLAAGAPLVGLVPMLLLFVLFMLLAVLRQRLLPSLVSALVIVGGVHLVFVRWLSVALPAPLGL
jgi:hypothetical protein